MSAIFKLKDQLSLKITSQQNLKQQFLLGIYSFLLLIYTVFSYSLTAPNLVLSSWSPYWQFQIWMWANFFNNRQLLTYSYITVILALFLAYFFLIKNWPKKQKMGWWLPLLVAAPLLFSNNALSHDVFNYIFNAKMVLVYHANPHLQTALDFASDNWTRFMHNTHTPAPYFYGWTGLSLLPFSLGGGKFFPTWMIFKVFSFSSLGWLSFILSKKLKKQTNSWLPALFFNPLLLIEVLSNAHNDLWMMAPAVTAMLLLTQEKTKKKIFLSLFFLLFSASMKIATLALLPIWLALVLPWEKAWPKLHELILANWPFLSSVGLFLPLLTPRSKQFLPWYLIWSLVWLPLIDKKWKNWQLSLVILSFSAMLRYVPFLFTGDYENQIIAQQLWITWLPFIIFWLIMFSQKILKRWLIPSLLILFYFISHLFQLTLLPVFADEAIYIRWTQLIIDDWQQYLFFPLNDGKTPLLMWLMVPFQLFFSNQLFAGRLVGVLIGLGQILSLGYLTKLLGGSKKASWLAILLGSTLPFWYFHQRMALTDGLLVLGIILTVIGVIQIIQNKKKSLWIGLTSLFFGLSLWAKLPALLVIPSLFLYPWMKPTEIKIKIKQLGLIFLAVLGGLGFFSTLKILPVFPQLFSRGGDFLYPWQEVIFQGKWKNTLFNMPTYLNYFGVYLGWGVLGLNMIGQFFTEIKKRRTQHLLLLSALFFVGPVALLGKVVYPRYLFPASIFLTVSAALVLSELVKFTNKQASYLKKVILGTTLGLIIICITANSGKFIFYSLTNTTQIPFVSADQEQYLYEWSAGHGVAESVTLIQTLAQDHSVAIATEGYFGTLPDGLLMYLHRQDVSNIYVEGIGQPVFELSAKFVERAQTFDQALLIVNSHRLQMKLPPKNILQEYCRPHHKPCLQVWDVTQLVK